MTILKLYRSNSVPAAASPWKHEVLPIYEGMIALSIQALPDGPARNTIKALFTGALTDTLIDHELWNLVNQIPSTACPDLLSFTLRYLRVNGDELM